MNLIKCENQHYFDADKFRECPHCANLQAATAYPDPNGQQQKSIDTAIPNAELLEHYTKEDQRRCVGWLVCIRGTMLGDSFTLYNKENHIGRGAHMDVALFKEATVSRENHAILSYEEATLSYELKPNKTSPLLINGIAVTTPTLLRSYDVLELGDCQLLFIALCNETFSWSEEIS